MSRSLTLCRINRRRRRISIIAVPLLHWLRIFLNYISIHLLRASSLASSISIATYTADNLFTYKLAPNVAHPTQPRTTMLRLLYTYQKVLLLTQLKGFNLVGTEIVNVIKMNFNHHPRLLYTSRVQRPQPSPLWVPRPPSQCVNHSLEVGACVVLLVALQEGYPQRVLHYRCSGDEFSLRISPRRVSLRCLGAFRSQWKVV
jgi:hypothetical protein